MEIQNSFLNLFRINKNENIQAKQNTNYLKGITNPLRPLEADTISFTGKKVKQEKEISSSSDKKISKSERCSLNLTQQIYDESDRAYDKLKQTLRDAFPKSDVIDLETDAAEGRVLRAIHQDHDTPVIMIVTRKKTPDSMSEKMAQKHIRSKKAAKKEIKDILGARIIVSENDPKSGDYVLGQLSKAIKKNKLKITSVKNHGQDDSKLNYASQKKLLKFVNTARENGCPNCEYHDQPRDTGYIAMHILTDEIEDGFSAEIQIMGSNVERFKHIEDLFYKCLSDKEIPKKYKPLKEMLTPIKEDEQLGSDFREYTRRAYAYERQKVARSNEMASFLHIPDDLDIPEEFDFNNIETTKRYLDFVHKPKK